MEWNVSMGGRPLEEIELVDRAKRGDVGAYEELVRMHQNLAARTAYVITGQAADAQDAVQEAFVKAYRSLGRFREGAAFRPWLLRIVANEAITRRRAAHRQTTLALRATATPHGDGPPAASELLQNMGEGRYTISFEDLPPGAYDVMVTSAVPNRPVDPVSGVTLVWDEEGD